ncbi:Methyltransferase-like protein 5 [Coelomomyces lativittatus]|nr:Methyltransferase-like protein 5 [Coelomomyces lativittatus]
MKLKELESELQCIQPFKHPKVNLEQYPTSPHLASRLVYTAETVYGDIQGKVVADFGTGCGVTR